MLTEGNGIPLSVAVDGANRHDKKLVKATLDAIVIERPSSDSGSEEEAKQNMCMDKGYDYPDIKELVEEYGYTAHIRSRGEENNEKSKYQVIEQEDGSWKGLIRGWTDSEDYS